MATTKNLKLVPYTDSVTFSRRLVVSGADPMHSKDLKQMGGVFNCYLEIGGRGWVFSVSMEPVLEEYIKTGKIPHKKKTTNIFKPKLKHEIITKKLDSGLCKICKKGMSLDAAVKSYIRYHVGGLPKKIAGMILDKDYRKRIATAFGDGTFICTSCLAVEKNTEPDCWSEDDAKVAY